MVRSTCLMHRVTQSLGICSLMLACFLGGGVTVSQAAESFALSSPMMEDQGMLPLSSKCQRDNGEGLSPALEWTSAPQGTQSFVVVMHHYPRGTVPGRDAPSHYWLLWNIPADVLSLSLGNKESYGDEGANKDRRGVGYTPPCAPDHTKHAYTITVYALSAAPDALGTGDNPGVDWSAVMAAIEGKVIASSELTFFN